MNRNRVISLITITITLLAFLIIQPTTNPMAVTKITASIASVMFIGIMIYDNFLWKKAPFYKLHKTIDISGIWEGKMVENGKQLDSILKIKIKQSLDSIKVTILNDDFIGESISSNLIVKKTGVHLYFNYRITNENKITSKNDITYGTMILQCDPDFLKGDFFTSRGQKRSVEFYRV